MEWYLWILVGYFGIGLLFSLVGTVLMLTRYIRLSAYSTKEKIFYLMAAIFVWPYIVYNLLGGN